MKLSPRSTERTCAPPLPFLLALLLALAILPGCRPRTAPGHTGLRRAAGPGGRPGGDPNSPGGNPPGGQPTAVPQRPPPPSASGNPGGGGPGNGGPGPGGPPSGTAHAPPPSQPPSPAPTSPIPARPLRRPANCIVAHAATPAQVCPVGGGLQYYYIGANGSSQQGPWIAPFSQLSASVFSGTNPMTGKSVTITYLAAENKIRISTFYPDNEYDTNKPYNFTVDASNNVAHEAW